MECKEEEDGGRVKSFLVPFPTVTPTPAHVIYVHASTSRNRMRVSPTSRMIGTPATWAKCW